MQGRIDHQIDVDKRGFVHSSRRAPAVIEQLRRAKSNKGADPQNPELIGAELT
jgi:hypothetical protein